MTECNPRVRPEYLSYLESAEGRSKRAVALERAGNRCRVCSGHRDLEVHHISYERLGHERMSDLVVLCADHHHTVTIAIRYKRSRRSPSSPLPSRLRLDQLAALDTSADADVRGSLFLSYLRTRISGSGMPLAWALLSNPDFVTSCENMSVGMTRKQRLDYMHTHARGTIGLTRGRIASLLSDFLQKERRARREVLGRQKTLDIKRRRERIALTAIKTEFGGSDSFLSFLLNYRVSERGHPARATVAKKLVCNPDFVSPFRDRSSAIAETIGCIDGLGLKKKNYHLARELWGIYRSEAGRNIGRRRWDEGLSCSTT